MPQDAPPTIPYPPAGSDVLKETQMKQRASDFYIQMKQRRTVRNFSDKAVDQNIIENCIKAASTAPSGANCQPWSFVAVSDPAIKKQIRNEAEQVEAEFYSAEATKNWVKDLAHLGTVPSKPFLEKAPVLIAIFSQLYGLSPEGKKSKHYYVTESVGIATGIFITALHTAGLSALTYTPANMRFLNRVLDRPANEKPFMILVTGYPADDTRVPVIEKKSLNEVATFI